jgi:hypothetical protein
LAAFSQWLRIRDISMTAKLNIDLKQGLSGRTRARNRGFGVETAIENVESTVVRRLIAKEAGVRAFRPGQAFMRSAKFPKKRENGRENPAFCTFDFVSGLLVRRSCAIC